MKIFNNLINSFKSNDDVEHAVIVNFNYHHEKLDALHALAMRLNDHLEGSGLGDYDGHETQVNGPDANLYLYGNNAEELFISIKPILNQTDFMNGAIATLRFGPPEKGVKEISVEV